MSGNYQTLSKLVDMADLSWNSYQQILSEKFRIERAAAKGVPRLLTEDQK